MERTIFTRENQTWFLLRTRPRINPTNWSVQNTILNRYIWRYGAFQRSIIMRLARASLRERRLLKKACEGGEEQRRARRRKTYGSDVPRAATSGIARSRARLFIKCSPLVAASRSNLIRPQLKQILSDRSRADWLFRPTGSPTALRRRTGMTG